MKSIVFDEKTLHFDCSLGSINDVFIKELGGKFEDISNMQELENNAPKMVELVRDLLLSGHIYWLFCNGEEEEGERLLSKIRSSRMIATKWVLQEGLINVIQGITQDLFPNDLDTPREEVKTPKKK